MTTAGGGGGAGGNGVLGKRMQHTRCRVWRSAISSSIVQGGHLPLLFSIQLHRVTAKYSTPSIIGYEMPFERQCDPNEIRYLRLHGFPADELLANGCFLSLTMLNCCDWRGLFILGSVVHLGGSNSLQDR